MNSDRRCAEQRPWIDAQRPAQRPRRHADDRGEPMFVAAPGLGEVAGKEWRVDPVEPEELPDWRECCDLIDGATGEVVSREDLE